MTNPRLMLNQIKLFFEEYLGFTVDDSDPEAQLRLASVALFMEMLVMDEREDAQERALIAKLVQKSFSLAPEQTDALMEEAEQCRKQATDYYQFTALINKSYSPEQKIDLIESLWRIAFADGVLDPQEEYLVRKIANLLYVPHIDFIMAKNRVDPK